MEKKLTISFSDAYSHNNIEFTALGGSLYYRDLANTLRLRNNYFKYIVHSFEDVILGKPSHIQYDAILSMIGQYAFFYYYYRQQPFSIIRDCHTVGWWGHIFQEIICSFFSTPSDVVFFPSNYAKDFYHNKICKNTKKRVGYGINLPSQEVIKRLKDQKLKKKSVNILFIGRLGTDKNFIAILRAFLRLFRLRPDIKLVVAGPSLEYPFGSNLDFIRQIIKKANAEKNFEYLGYVSDAEKWKLYSQSDIFLFPPTSLHESLCRTIVEAKYCGLPVITSRFGPMLELVEHKKSGLLIDVFPREKKNIFSGGPGVDVDLDKLVDACLGLIDNEEQRVKLGETGKERMNKYSLGFFINELEDTFRSTLPQEKLSRLPDTPFAECTDILIPELLEFLSFTGSVKILMKKSIEYAKTMYMNNKLTLGNFIPPEKIGMTVKEEIGDYLFSR